MFTLQIIAKACDFKTDLIKISCLANKLASMIRALSEGIKRYLETIPELCMILLSREHSLNQRIELFLALQTYHEKNVNNFNSSELIMLLEISDVIIMITLHNSGGILKLY